MNAPARQVPGERTSTIGRRALLGTTAAGAGVMATTTTAGAQPPQESPRTHGPLVGNAGWNRLHVMSLNIRMDDSENTAPGDPDHWPERAPLLVELLRRESPALLGIQEGLFHQLATIEKALPKHRKLGFGRQGGSKDEYSAIFYDPLRLEALGWDQFWLSDTPESIGSAAWGNSVTRIVTWARFRDKHTGLEFAHINTHFDHESDNARSRSAEVVAQLASGDDLDGLPIIVTGDFNAAAGDSTPYETLVTAGPFEDSWDTATKRLSPAWGTAPGYEEPTEGEDRIDWILATEDLRVRKVGINDWRGRNGRFPSDHLPVQALISLG